ncbi:MAG: Asp23/Gls24 family envelope stress response protein [Clostridia bacterium]|nr:Asp23/Gls24 family envelope stress response protein [Clostridia bacterium]
MIEAFELGDDANETEIHTDTDEPIGNVKISVEVVAKIAGIAASEIDGVSAMHKSFVGGVAQKLGKKNSSQGVKVEINEEMTTIDLYLVVEYGVKIPELAWNVQESVKASVEAMTGLNVAAVNIHIEGIDFGKDIDLPEE